MVEEKPTGVVCVAGRGSAGGILEFPILSWSKRCSITGCCEGGGLRALIKAGAVKLGRFARAIELMVKFKLGR